MSGRTLPHSLGIDMLAVKSAAFDLSPDPAMVVDAEFGRLVGEQQKIVADLVRSARIPQQ